MPASEDSDFQEKSEHAHFENRGHEPHSKSTSERKRRFRFEDMYTVIGGQYVMPLDDD